MHYVRTNPQFKMLVRTDKKNIITFNPSTAINNANILEIKDGKMVLLYYNFYRYKKAYLIRTDIKRGKINLPETNIHGEILISAKRQKGADLIKYVDEICRIKGTMDIDTIAYKKLSLILRTAPFNLQNCQIALSLTQPINN